MKSLIFLFTIAYVVGCPPLTAFEPNGITHGFINMACPECVNTANRFDLNCRGINQSFPVGTIIVNANDSAQLVSRERGCLIISLWCGWQDTAQTIPMANDTLIPTYSVSKTLVSAAVMMQVDRGYMKWNDTVCQYWEGFCQNGKKDIQVQQVAANYAALPFVKSLTASDIALGGNISRLRNLIETQYPIYGSSSNSDDGVFGYVPSIWGQVLFILSTMVDPWGRDIVEFITQEITNKTGSSIHWGIAINDTETYAKTADIGFGTLPPSTCSGAVALALAFADNCSLQYKAIYNPLEIASNVLLINEPIGRAINNPSYAVFSSANDWALALDPFTLGDDSSTFLCTSDAIDTGTETLFNGTDAHSYEGVSYGRSGVWKNSPGLIFSPTSHAWGHTVHIILKKYLI
jgi:hypothetical protein